VIRFIAVSTLMMWLVLGVDPAQAQLRSGSYSQNRMALETYVETRPDGADAVMDILHKLMGASYIWDPRIVGLPLASHGTSKGQTDPTYTGAVFIAEVKIATDEWSSGEFASARRLFDNAILHARQNPLALANDASARVAMRQALMLLALVNKRISETVTGSRDKAAAVARRDAALGELIRTFESTVTRNEFGNEAAMLYAGAKEAMSANKPGQLRIVLVEPPPGLTVSINEKPQAMGALVPLQPGEYRILAWATTGVARQYKIEVMPDAIASIVINWKVDSVLELGAWVGFRYPSRFARDVEQDLILALHQDQSILGEVCTFHLSEATSQLSLQATLYNQTGRKIRQGKVELDGTHAASNQDRIRRLLNYLDGVKDGSVVGTDDETAQAQLTAGNESAQAVGAAATPPLSIATQATDKSRRAPAALMVLGGAGIATGLVLFALNDPDGAVPAGQPQPRYRRDTILPATLVTAGGVLAVGIGYLWWRRWAPSRPRPMVSVLPTGAAIIIAGSF
jgi:hypothetical protein